jgi:ribosome-associated GTPase EngA
MSFTIAIVGRPNVGKSTLYNRLIGRRDAIVDNISGVTRDRNYGESHWNGKRFNVIDTGGFVAHSDDVFEKAIREQVQIAIEEASLIIFMVDVTTGITDLDEDMTKLLRRSPKRVFLAVNKVDNNRRLLESAEFYGLGLNDLYPIASISGSGTGDLLDAVAECIPESERISDEEAEALDNAYYEGEDDHDDDGYFYPEAIPSSAAAQALLKDDDLDEDFVYLFNDELVEELDDDEQEADSKNDADLTDEDLENEDDEEEWDETDEQDEDELDETDEDEADNKPAPHQKRRVSIADIEAQADDTKSHRGAAKANHIPRFAIIGQPNVGKSSLLNALVGEPRNIVTDIAGTTRDSTHTHYKMYGKEFILVDTAGIRKKAKVHENLEFYSVMRAIKAMDDADVCLLMIDAKSGVEQQDLNIFRLAVKKKKGIVVLINKWDLIEKETNTARDYTENIKRSLSPFSDVPIIFISATEKQRIFKAVETAIDVYQRRDQRIATNKLNEVMLAAVERYHPPAVRGNYIRIKYITQLPTRNPSFAFFANHPADIKQPYRNYLENQLRLNFNFTGIPLTIYFRQK